MSEREEFEKFMKDLHPQAYLKRTESGRYKRSDIQILWSGFEAGMKAARESNGGESLIEWSEHRPGNPEIPYDHVVAETPFGRFEITWKGWKENDCPTVDETPWGDYFGVFYDVDEAKAACEKEYSRRLKSAYPSTPQLNKCIPEGWKIRCMPHDTLEAGKIQVSSPDDHHCMLERRRQMAPHHPMNMFYALAETLIGNPPAGGSTSE